MDEEKQVRVQDDLFQYVNGAWLKSAVIPSDRPTTGGFADLDVGVEKTLMEDFKAMVAPLTAGLLEDVFPTTPILTLNIFLVIHILFLMIQDKQIYNDALTNLNNRRHLNQFLEEHLSKASPERPVTVFMIDINGFKSINDRFGHVEGDNALRFFADIMRANVNG